MIRQILHTLNIFCFCLFLWEPIQVLAQNSRTVSDLERIRQQANASFRSGDYVRSTKLNRAAIALCEVDLKMCDADDIRILKSYVGRSEKLQNLRERADFALRNRQVDEWKKISKEIVLLNPTDQGATRAISPIGITPLSKDDIRIIARARELNKEGNHDYARQILQAIPNSSHPEVVELKKSSKAIDELKREIMAFCQNGATQKALDRGDVLVRRFPEQTDWVSENLPNRERFNTLKKQAIRYANGCNYEQTIRVFRQLNQTVSVCGRDQYARNKINELNTIELKLNNIAEWRTDQSKRQSIIQAYSYVFKRYPNCIRSNYFLYHFGVAQTRMRNGLYPEAISDFENARGISSSMSAQYGITGLISICNDSVACFGKMQVFRQLVATADRLYKQCLTDSALAVFQRAETYNCNPKIGNAIVKVWKKRRSATVDGQLISQRFVLLLTEAEELLSDGNCQLAKSKYVEADSLETSCKQLDKSPISQGIMKCEKCIRRQQFDSLLVEAANSRSKRFFRDELESYRKALVVAPEEVNRVNQERLNKLECELEGKNCPIVVNDPLLAITKAYLVGGTNALMPKLTDASGSLTTGFVVGYKAGVRLERISFKKNIDYRIEANFATYRFNRLSTSRLIAQSFEIGVIESNLGIKFHNVSKSKKQPRLYLAFDGGYSRPITYRSSDFSSGLSYRSLNHISQKGFINGRAGVGMEAHQRKWGYTIEANYGFILNNLFVIDPQGVYNPRNYSATMSPIAGISLGIHF